jgi:uncharacterized secreted protein with C-terminal beta-propeller domain
MGLIIAGVCLVIAVGMLVYIFVYSMMRVRHIDGNTKSISRGKEKTAWIRSKKVKKRIKELNDRIKELEKLNEKLKGENLDLLTMRSKAHEERLKLKSEFEKKNKLYIDQHWEELERIHRLLEWQRMAYDSLEKMYMDLSEDEPVELKRR